MNIGTWQVRGRRKFCCRWILNRTLWITAEPFLVKWQNELFFFVPSICASNLTFWGQKRERNAEFQSVWHLLQETTQDSSAWATLEDGDMDGDLGLHCRTTKAPSSPALSHQLHVLFPTNQQPLFTPYSSGWVLWLLLGVLEDALLKQDVSDRGNRAIRSRCSRDLGRQLLGNALLP